MTSLMLGDLILESSTPSLNAPLKSVKIKLVLRKNIQNYPSSGLL